MQVQTFVAFAVSAAVAGTTVEYSDPSIWWMNFAEKFGITAALLLYFIIRDYQNKKQSDKERDLMMKKLKTLEDRQNETMSNYLNQFNTTLAESIRINKVVVKTLNKHYRTEDD